MAVFEYETILECSPESLFAFLRRPQNVAQVSKPDLGITFTSAPELIEEGSRIDFQIVSFGQVIKASHLIKRLDEPRLVVEEQISGPMKAWTHRHEYVPVESGVAKRDIIDFQLPGGILGLLISEAKVIDHLDDGCYYREQRLKELVERGILS